MSLDKENLKSLLSEATISEETIEALGGLITEAIATQKVEAAAAAEAKIAALNEQHEAALAEAAELNEAKLQEAVDAAVEAYVVENEQKFVTTEQFEKMSALFESVKAAFENAAFSLNENAAVQALEGKLHEASETYDGLLERFMALKEENESVAAELETAKRSIIFESAVKDLTDTQRERVGALVETIEFADTGEFASGLKLIVEMECKKDGDGDGKKDSDGDGEDDDDVKGAGGKEGKKDEGDSLKESRIDPKFDVPLYKLTPEERMARYKAGR